MIETLHYMEKLTRILRDERVVVAMDANAESVHWVANTMTEDELWSSG